MLFDSFVLLYLYVRKSILRSGEKQKRLFFNLLLKTKLLCELNFFIYMYC